MAPTEQFLTTAAAAGEPDERNGKASELGGGSDDMESQKPPLKKSITRTATMLPESVLEHQRHGTWVSSVFHIITAVMWVYWRWGRGRCLCPMRPCGDAAIGASLPRAAAAAAGGACLAPPAGLELVRGPRPHLSPLSLLSLPCLPLLQRIRSVVPPVLRRDIGLGGRHRHDPDLWSHHL